MSLAISLFVFAIVYLLLRSRHGLALTAIRDSEPASASLGVNTFRTKFIIYIATAACTGLIGGLIFLQKLRISPEAGFSINDWTVVVIFMVVIGGIGTLEGPFIGMLIYIVLRELLADYGAIYLMLMGAIAIAVMLKAPFGIWGWVVQRYDVQLFPGRPAPGAGAGGGRVQVDRSTKCPSPGDSAEHHRTRDGRPRPRPGAALRRARRGGGRGAANSRGVGQGNARCRLRPHPVAEGDSAATGSASTPGSTSCARSARPMPRTAGAPA